MAIFLNIYAQKPLKEKYSMPTTIILSVGATITFAGKVGATSDKDGMFSIDCNKVARITVSFVGYETYQQTIKNCDDEINIGLVPVGHILDDVEITATSNQNKSLFYQPASLRS